VNVIVATKQAWTALKNYNQPPIMFRFGDELVRIVLDEGITRLQKLDVKILNNEMGCCANWYVEIGKKEVSKFRSASLPSKRIVENMLYEREIPLPKLTRLVDVPIFDKTGELVDKQGYDTKSGIFYLPSPGLELERVSFDEAKRLLLELVGPI